MVRQKQKAPDWYGASVVSMNPRKALSSKSGGKPRFKLGELRLVGSGRRWDRALLNRLQPSRYLLRCEHVSLPANRQGTLEDFQHFVERETVSETLGDIGLALPLDLRRICT